MIGRPTTEPQKPRVIPPFNDTQVVVKEGDIYVWLFDVGCRSGRHQRRGSKLIVDKRTTLTPHHEISFSGYNWFCRTASGHITVWATVESCIQRGLLKKVKDGIDRAN